MVERPAIYDELSIPFFISGYLAILNQVKVALKLAMTKHLKELVVATELPYCLAAADRKWES